MRIYNHRLLYYHRVSGSKFVYYKIMNITVTSFTAADNSTKKRANLLPVNIHVTL